MTNANPSNPTRTKVESHLSLPYAQSVKLTELLAIEGAYTCSDNHTVVNVKGHRLQVSQSGYVSLSEEIA
jgi:hypothetical protein